MSLRKNLKKFVPIWTSVACCAMGCFYSCNDGYNLIEEDPSWLGSSIYDYLKSNGNYTNVVRMIDDLGYADVLARTGSKTLFVADDEAYARFFNSRKWGVGSYEELSQSQKKMLLYGAMINNSCQVAYLSSSMGPTEGDCMRRLTSASEYDTVPILTPADMPDTKYWAYYKNAGKTIPCLEDMTTAPMIHFIEAYLQNRQITNADCDFLMNHTTQRKAGDASVNGVNMVEQNIRCSNGFIHKMGEVTPPLSNMANVIAGMSRAQKYSELLDRFSAPFYNETATREYNRLYGTNYDSVFQKRYFSERSQNGNPLNLTQRDEPVESTLKFDPGWNEYYSALTMSEGADVLLQQDMAVMLVPTDAALQDYWDNGAGKVLKDEYETWENVPDNVLSKLINVNMFNSFSNTVPSKFHTVLNDANEDLDLDEEDVDSVFLACNGAIYLTNKVFSPAAYISVSFPALIKENMNIINWAIEQYDYDVYLNSQNSRYSFFIPTNEALQCYIDPSSFRVREDVTQPDLNLRALKFHYNPDAQTEADRVYASVHSYDPATGHMGDSIADKRGDVLRSILIDILETHIVIGDLDPSNTYFHTKDGGTMKIENPTIKGAMRVFGSRQVEDGEEGELITAEDTYDGPENGVAYIMTDAPIMTARNSVADILETHPEFSEFKALLDETGFLTTSMALVENEDNPEDTEAHACPSNNLNLFNTYNYTVYVPTNESIKDLQDEGKLPTVADLNDPNLTEEEQEELREQVRQFVRYHIQDNSVFIGEGDVNQGPDPVQYETAAYSQAGGTFSYLKLTPQATNTRMTVTDAVGNVRNVLTGNGLYNLMAREYQFNSDNVENATALYTSSYAVVHQIDGPLMYE